MATLIGPFSVGYPVDFKSNGDTTKDAFGKHIQEITKIYGILNALDAGKVSSDGVTSAVNSALAAHVSSTNPHPNWKPSYSFSELTGTIDASKISGKLSNANIDYGKVNGLENYVRGLIPSGNGITASALQPKGYAKFANGLTIQWETSYSGNTYQDVANSVLFPIPFTANCFTVSLSTAIDKINGVADVWAELIVNSVTTNGFQYMFQYVTDSYNGMANFTGRIGVSYIAIGV